MQCFGVKKFISAIEFHILTLLDTPKLNMAAIKSVSVTF